MNCDDVDKLPQLNFQIGEENYILKGKDYVLKLETENLVKCVIGISGIGENERFKNTWILGDMFLKTYYSIYDMDNLQIGLAKAK